MPRPIRIEYAGAVYHVMTRGNKPPADLQDDILEKRKGGPKLLMYVARHYTRAVFREVADRLAVRDISTVSHGVSRVERQLQARGKVAEELENNLKRIHSLIQAHHLPHRTPSVARDIADQFHLMVGSDL